MGLPGLMTTKARTFLPEARSAATDCFRASICSHEVRHHNDVSCILVARIQGCKDTRMQTYVQAPAVSLFQVVAAIGASKQGDSASVQRVLCSNNSRGEQAGWAA